MTRTGQGQQTDSDVLTVHTDFWSLFLPARTWSFPFSSLASFSKTGTVECNKDVLISTRIPWCSRVIYKIKISYVKNSLCRTHAGRQHLLSDHGHGTEPPETSWMGCAQFSLSLPCSQPSLSYSKAQILTSEVSGKLPSIDFPFQVFVAWT